MDDGRSGKQNQRKVAEELKGLIKAVKDVRSFFYLLSHVFRISLHIDWN